MEVLQTQTGTLDVSWGVRDTRTFIVCEPVYDIVRKHTREASSDYIYVADTDVCSVIAH